MINECRLSTHTGATLSPAFAIFKQINYEMIYQNQARPYLLSMVLRMAQLHTNKRKLSKARRPKMITKVRRGRARNIQRDRNFALRHMAELRETNFKRMFRLSRTSFQLLLDKISPHLPKISKIHAIRSSGSCISNITRLASTLRYLAGGSYLERSK